MKSTTTRGRKPATAKPAAKAPAMPMETLEEITADVAFAVTALSSGYTVRQARHMAEHGGDGEAMGNRTSRGAMPDDGQPIEGVSLEEISQLLQGREAKGWMRGHEEGYRDAKHGIEHRIAAVRAEAVSGTLLFVVEQLEQVVKALAETGRDAKQVGAQRLVVLATEFARAAERQRDEIGF